MRFLSAAYSNSAFSLLACRVALLLNLICFQVEAVKMRRKISFTFSFSAFFLIWILLFIFGQMAYYYTKRLVFFSIRFIFRVHCFVFRLLFRYQAFAFFQGDISINGVGTHEQLRNCHINPNYFQWYYALLIEFSIRLLEAVVFEQRKRFCADTDSLCEISARSVNFHIRFAEVFK